jgi:hypothetical protein
VVRHYTRNTTERAFVDHGRWVGQRETGDKRESPSYLVRDWLVMHMVQPRMPVQAAAELNEALGQGLRCPSDKRKMGGEHYQAGGTCEAS